jgi:uncharacterized membrane protein (GlpM family)
MTPRFDFAELRKSSARQYIVRFFFGGAVTMMTGWIAHTWGPLIGGLFLAFPAVLPASLTFVKDDDGRRAAREDARGARLGALALCGFAVLVWMFADRLSPPLALCLSLALWMLVSVCLWWIATRRDPS